MNTHTHPVMCLSNHGAAAQHTTDGISPIGACPPTAQATAVACTGLLGLFVVCILATESSPTQAPGRGLQGCPLTF